MTVYFHRNKKEKKSQVKKMVVRPWLANDRWLQFGIYDQLIAEFRREDTDLEAFINFKRMPPEVYGDVLTRVAPRISVKIGWWRAPIEPGMKLALAL